MKNTTGLKRMAGFCLIFVFAGSLPAIQPVKGNVAEDLPVYYEELTVGQFVQAVAKGAGTCVIPLGIMEKHGNQLPLGTDLFTARETARLAAQKEYTIIFPPYYFGQIFEAKHQPGTLAYSQKLIFDLLQETCAELARNGIKKIILISGHGGNEHFIPYFCQAQLAERKDYAVYYFNPEVDFEQDPEVKKLIKTTSEMHAGERETSELMAIAPHLVHLDNIDPAGGTDLKRMQGIQNIYTGIWWYASFPDHYAGDARPASAELGKLLLAKNAELLTSLIRQVKQDKTVLELQDKFYKDAEKPLGKKQ